jgi:hypothetical protein
VSPFPRRLNPFNTHKIRYASVRYLRRTHIQALAYKSTAWNEAFQGNSLSLNGVRTCPPCKKHDVSVPCLHDQATGPCDQPPESSHHITIFYLFKPVLILSSYLLKGLRNGFLSSSVPHKEHLFFPTGFTVPEPLMGPPNSFLWRVQIRMHTDSNSTASNRLQHSKSLSWSTHFRYKQFRSQFVSGAAVTLSVIIIIIIIVITNIFFSSNESITNINRKGKVNPRTGHVGREGE